MRGVWLALLVVMAGCVGVAEVPSESPQQVPVQVEEPQEVQEPQSVEPQGKDPEPQQEPEAEPEPEPSNETASNTTAPEPAKPPFWYPTSPSMREWGGPDAATIRPGVDVVGGGQCTSNFVFHVNDERYFLGVAAHCFQDDDDPLYESCPSPGAMAPGAVAKIYDVDNRIFEAPLVYSSFHTMNTNGEKDFAVCEANDFALVEVPQDAWGTLHPSVLSFGGPVALASPETYLKSGDELIAYLNSDSRPTFWLHGEGFVGRGPFTQYTASGWGIQGGPMFLPMVPGDSGGPVLDEDGNAIGAASVLKTTSGETRWTNITRALWYMYEHEGWAPSLVTWDEFSG